MKKSTCTPSVLMALSTLALPAFAGDMPPVQISGFGTAALTMSDTDQAEFIRNNQAAGVKKDPRTGVDSNFGIQGTSKMNDWLSFTVQGLVRKFATDNYGAELAWAFAKAKVNDDFTVRVGRIGLPVYMVSDYRNVGYANTMIRPPIEVYRQVNIDFVDGADVVFQHSYGDTTLTAQFAAGSSRALGVGGSVGHFNPLTALHVVAETGPFTLRFGRADAKFSVKNTAALDGLAAGLTAFGYKDVGDVLPFQDVKGSFTSLGFGMDWKNIIIQSEYAKRKSDRRTLMDTTSWYTMFGYRMGNFTPYFDHSTVSQNSIRSFSQLPTNATGTLAALVAGANGAIKTGLQTTNTVGLRWDFSKSAAFKIQADRVTPRNGAGSFLKAVPGFTGPVMVYAAGIDFVF
jgi:hypothetical protein